MKRRTALWLMLALLLLGIVPQTALAQPDSSELVGRLQAIYDLRSRWILTSGSPPPIDGDYLPGANAAKWALQHEHGKIRYMRKWAENRGVQIVEAKATIHPKLISRSPEKARFYVAQSLQLGYTYPGDQTINRSGYGTRHIVELRQQDGKWLIGMEWYTDPLGDDTEIPDVTPALASGPLPAHLDTWPPESRTAAAGGYDRSGAVDYADQYCGLAWGCGNANRYNPRYRDYNGNGGDCTNFVAQALAVGGRLRIPIIIRVETMAAHLQYSGRAALVARGSFQPLWHRAQKEPDGFRSLLREGDLIAYQEKGKLEHFGIVTAFDSRGYPLVNSHTADRYHVPFDLGWDRKTVYWLFRMRD